MITSYEIDFLPVGNGEKSGDCILFHYFEDGIEKIIAYDGGTRKSGEAMVAHIKKYYGTQKIDYLINSHPVICAELAGDFHLGYARQLTDKSSLLFDLAF